MAKLPQKQTQSSSRAKRSAPPIRTGLRMSAGHDIRKDFSQRQLTLIGTFLMQWNELEERFAGVYLAALNLPNIMHRTALRSIPSLDARIAMARSFVLAAQPPKDIKPLFENSFAMTADLGAYRDLLAHCRMFNMDQKIAEAGNRKDNPQQILISDETLLGQFARVKILWEELLHLEVIFLEITRRVIFPPDTVPEEQRRKQAIRDGVEKLKELQKRRARLPPLPAFPAEFLSSQRPEE